MPLQVGIAGLRRGLGHLRVFQNHPEAEVVALCDLDAPRVEEVAGEHGVEGQYAEFHQFLQHPGLEAVVIATPLPLHAEQCVAALEAEKHVLCEVPAIATLAEAEAVVRAARQSRAKYMFAENCCYWAFVQSWQAMVEQGRIGKPIYAEAEYVHDCRSLFRNPDGTATWRAFMPPIHYCTHSLGPILEITGQRVVSATGLHTGSNVDTEFGTIDMEVGLFRTDAGMPVKILCGFSVERSPAFHTFQVYGTQGCLEKPRLEDKTLACFADIPEMLGMAELPLTTRHKRAPAHAAAGGHGTAEFAMINAFVSALAEDAPMPIDVYRGMDMTLPGICAHLSAEQGGAVVDVPDLR